MLSSERIGSNERIQSGSAQAGIIVWVNPMRDFAIGAANCRRPLA
jgi:hypothetical protein